MIIYYVLNKLTQICIQINYKASPCSGCLRIKFCIIQQDKKVLILAVNVNLILMYYGCKYQNVAAIGKKSISALSYWSIARIGPCLSMYVYSTCQPIHEKQEE